MRGLLRNLGVGLYCDSSSYEAEETAVSSVAPPQTVSSSGCQQGEPIAQAWVTLSRLCNLENCGEESKPQAWGLSHIQTDACTWDNTEKFVQKDITHTSPQSDAQTHTYTHNTCIHTYLHTDTPGHCLSLSQHQKWMLQGKSMRALREKV